MTVDVPTEQTIIPLFDEPKGHNSPKLIGWYDQRTQLILRLDHEPSESRKENNHINQTHGKRLNAAEALGYSVEPYVPGHNRRWIRRG